MRLQTILRGVLAACALTLAACAGAPPRQAIATVTVEPDGRIAIARFNTELPAEAAERLKRDVEGVEVRAMPDRAIRDTWQTHALIEYGDGADGRPQLRAIHLDPLLVDVKPMKFSIVEGSEAPAPGPAMRYYVRSAVTPYHVEMVPPSEFAVAPEMLTGVATIPLLFDVDAAGKVSNVRVARPEQKRAALERVVADSFAHWRFEPDTVDGRPISSEDLLAYVTVHATEDLIVRVYGERGPVLRAPLAAVARQ